MRRSESVLEAPINFVGCAAEFLELQDAILQVASSVLATGKIVNGPEVEKFEQRVARLTGRKHCVSVGSGTDALFFALTAAGIGIGDEVLVPDVSFIASGSAVVRTGATPVFVDIGKDCNMNFSMAEGLISARTKAVLLVHLFGGMADPAIALDFVNRHGLVLIEDAAQSLGASFAGRPCGSLGLAGAISFSPTKVISAPGNGGAMVTDDDLLAQKVRQLRMHGKQANGFVIRGYNSLLPTFAAAVLDLKFDRHEAWTARRREIAGEFARAFKGLPLEFPAWCDDVAHVWHKFTFRTELRAELIAYLADCKVPVMIHYQTPLHCEPTLGSKQNDSAFPEAMKHARTTLSLPMHSHLTENQIAHIIDSVKSFFR